MDKLFYELIRLSVGSCSVLSSHPSSHEWQSLRTKAIKQAIDGVSFEGFLKYQELSEDVQEYKKIKLQWIASVLQLEQRNELTNLRALQLTDFFNKGKFRTCVLKGQGVALLYPNPKHRRCGDIDLWVEGKRDDIVNYIRTLIPQHYYKLNFLST